MAQEIALQAPDLVRRLVLVGTGPRGGEGMATLTPEAQEIFGATYDDPDHLWLHVHFTHSEKSQAAGREFLKRFRLRTENREERENRARPTLVVNGSKDVIIYPVNSFILQQHLPERPSKLSVLLHKLPWGCS